MISSFLYSDAFREIFQIMSEGILIVDERGFMVAANPMSEQIFSYEKKGGFVGNQMGSLLAQCEWAAISISEKHLTNIPEPRHEQESTFSIPLPLT